MPLPLIVAYAPVPPEIVYVPCWLTVSKQVFGSNDRVPVPLECVILNVPPGSVVGDSAGSRASVPGTVPRTLRASRPHSITDCRDI